MRSYAAAVVLFASLVASAPPASAGEGDWPMAAKDYASTRYSALAEITAANVGKLVPKLTFSTGVVRGHEGAPIVVDGTMFIVTPFPNVVYALDLTRDGAPVKWKFEPHPTAASQGAACCDRVNRGAVYGEGRLFFNTLDDQTIALDARSGNELWRVRSGDFAKGETLTMAPVYANGRVLVGNSGGEYGVRGWLAALDARTGKELWRAYSTGPDGDVLIGAAFKPFYASDRGSDLGVSTWPSGAWKTGGGTVWGWISFDADQGLVIYGTANPGPWNPSQRPGDNKWTAGIFARDLETGAARWFYQMSPHDLYDYDGVNENILIDGTIGGRLRKLLVHPDRNGHLYVLDRTSGEVISATPFVHVTTSKGVDLETGRLRYAAEKEPIPGKVVRDICPAAPGGKDWQPSAYSPRTGLVYIPHQNLCQEEEVRAASYIAGTPYVGATLKIYAGPGGHRGAFSAWDPLTATKRWSIDEDLPVWSGALATGDDLVFYGTLDGWFKAVDAKDGKLLWQYKTASGIVGQPIAYRGPDGHQYIAILSGVGGWAGAVVAGDLDPRDATAATGFANALADLKQRTSKGGMLYVFGLP